MPDSLTFVSDTAPREVPRITPDDVRNYMVALRGVLHTLSEERKSLGELWDDMYNSAMLLFFIGVAIVGAVIFFSEKIGDRRPVRVLQRAGGLPLLPHPPSSSPPSPSSVPPSAPPPPPSTIPS